MDGVRKAHLYVRGKISVPVSQVKAVVADTEQMFAEPGIAGSVVAHAATGIVYFMCATDGLSPDRIAALRKRANDLGGWLTIEAAPRAVKRRLNVWDIPPGGLEIMKRIRASFDPKRTLNPGRFLEGI